jgi:hypothetical protein
MLSELFRAARRRLDPIGKIPLFIRAFSPFIDVTVAGSKTGVGRVLSTAASLFDRTELVKARIALTDWHDD